MKNWQNRRSELVWFSGVLLVLTFLGASYYIASTACLFASFNGKARAESPGFQPAVSILKPVCGVDRQAAANFASYMKQDYPDYEVIFGTLKATDPAIDVILDTMKGHKHASLRIGSTISGANNKVRILHQLAKHAWGEIIVITDADTRAEPSFLRAMVTPFQDSRVGMVTCLYKGVEAAGLADSLEALYMSSIFAGGVACAQQIGGLRFGLGAAVALRAEVLKAIGGFEPLADYLADDYQIGHRTALLGWKIELSRYVIDEVMSGESLRSVLSRELRWSRTTRVCRPLGHFGLIFTFGSVYALLLAAIWRSFSALSILIIVLVLRTVCAWLCARKLGDEEFPRRMHLLALRDVVSFFVWAAGYLGSTVKWRGRKLRLRKDGRMVRVSQCQKRG